MSPIIANATTHSELIGNTSKTQLLEEFWGKHKGYDTSAPEGESDSLLNSPVTGVHFSQPQRAPGKPKHGRLRSASDGAALLPPGNNLSAYHPAWSLLHLLETFGPLIFPIHRAAILRKRILITTHAPVEQTCNFGKQLECIYIFVQIT